MRTRPLQHAMTAKPSKNFQGLNLDPEKFWARVRQPGPALVEFATWCQVTVVATNETAADFLRALKPLDASVRIPSLRAELLQEIANFYRDPGLRFCAALPPHEVEASVRELVWLLRDHQGGNEGAIGGSGVQRMVDLFLAACFGDPKMKRQPAASGMSTEAPSLLSPSHPPPAAAAAAPPSPVAFPQLPAAQQPLALPGPSWAAAGPPVAVSLALPELFALLQSLAGVEPIQHSAPDTYAAVRRPILDKIRDLFQRHGHTLEQELRGASPEQPQAAAVDLVAALARSLSPADPVLPLLKLIEMLVAELLRP